LHSLYYTLCKKNYLKVIKSLKNFKQGKEKSLYERLGGYNAISLEGAR